MPVLRKSALQPQAYFVLLPILCLLTAPLRADSVLYSNGPVNGTYGAYAISSGFAVEDSFMLPSDSTVTGVSDVGLWAPLPPLTVQWSVLMGSSVLASGVANLNSTYVGIGAVEDGFTLNVYDANFSIGNLSLATGTYYLELQNATSGFEAPQQYWDTNNGPSVAHQFINGNPIGDPQGSQSFQIDGIATPEPASIGFAIPAVALFVCLVRRKRQSSASA